MELRLSSPRSRSKRDVGDRDSYVLHPKLRFACAGGTLFVFSHLDDLHFCHEAGVLQIRSQSPAGSGHRLAFVFRWLGLEKLFFAAPDKRHAVKLSQEEILAADQQQKGQRKRKMRQRRGAW